MSVASTIKLVVSGDTHGGIKALKDVQAEAGKTGLSFGTMAKAAGVGVLAIGTAAVAAGTVLVKAGDKLNESQDLLQNALKDTHQSVKGLGSALSPLMLQMQKWGYTNDEVNDGLATLVRAGDKLSTATSDMALAANIAKGRNIDLATAEQLLVKVRTGHVALLGRYGIATKDAQGKTISITQAVSKLSQMYKGSANTASESLAGKTAALHAAFTNLEEHLGQKLIPILTDVATWMTDKVLPAFAAMVGWVETNWPKLWNAIQPTIVKIQGYITGFVAFVQMLWKNFGGTIITFAKDAWGSVKTEIKGALDVISSVFRLFADLFTGKWGKLWGDILNIFRGLWQVITGVVGSAFAALKGLIGVVWDGIGTKAHQVWEDLIGYFKSIPGRLGSALSDIGSIFQGIFKGAFNFIIQMWDDTIGKIAHGQSYGVGPFHVTLPDLTIPKLHTGGIYDGPGTEGLALLRNGEGVFTPAQMRALGAGAGRGGATYINFPAGAAPAAVNAAQARWNRRNGKS